MVPEDNEINDQIHAQPAEQFEGPKEAVSHDSSFRHEDMKVPLVDEDNSSGNRESQFTEVEVENTDTENQLMQGIHDDIMNELLDFKIQVNNLGGTFATSLNDFITKNNKTDNEVKSPQHRFISSKNRRMITPKKWG